MSNIAVLENHTMQWDRPIAPTFTTLKAAIVVAWGQKISSLWLPQHHELSDEWDAIVQGAIGAGWITRETNGHVSSIETVSPRSGHRTLLINLNFTRDWPFAQMSAAGIYDALVHLERATGVEIGDHCYALAGIGAKWIRNYSNRAWLAPLVNRSINWTVASDLSWKRPLTTDEQRKRYIHLYDTNSAYLSVAATTTLSAGEPIPITTYQPNTRSLYYAHVVPRDSVWDNGMLPAPVHPGLHRQGVNHWYYEPVIRFAIDNGWDVTILDGWLFPETHTTLKTWAHEAWEARQKIRDMPIVNSMIKVAINAGMGLVDRPRPDVWGYIVSENRRRRLENVKQQMQDNAATPFVIDVDNIGYASNDPNPMTACPILMRRAHSLGGYKVAYSGPMIDGLGTAKTANELANLIKSVKVIA